MTETDSTVTKRAGIKYRCLNCQLYRGGCPTCGGKRYLTEKEALVVYGFIAPGLELPYCHICLNTNKDELFAYAVTVKKVENNQEFHLAKGTVVDYETKFIYRCKQSHGHEYPGWVFYDVFTQADIHLSISEQPR